MSQRRRAGSPGFTTTRCRPSVICPRRAAPVARSSTTTTTAGWTSIWSTAGRATSTPRRNRLRNALYRNNRDGTFTDVTEKAGVPGGTFGMGVAVGDYDNDGFPTSSSPHTAAACSTEQRRRHVHRRHGQGGARRAGMDDERGLVRLRQRRPARPVRLQLRRVRRQEQRRVRRQQAWPAVLLHPARLQADALAGSSTTTATARSPTSARAPTSSGRWARRWASWRPTSTTTGGWTCSSPTTRCRTSCS